MQYNLKGTGVAVTPEIREYLEERLRRHAEKFLRNDPAAHADAEIEHEPLRDGPHYRCEFTVSASGASFRAEAHGESLHEAIDVAVDELSRELRRAKGRRTHAVRRGALKIKEFVRGWRRRP